MRPVSIGYQPLGGSLRSPNSSKNISSNTDSSSESIYSSEDIWRPPTTELQRSTDGRYFPLELTCRDYVNRVVDIVGFGIGEHVIDVTRKENLDPLNQDEVDCGHALLRQMLGGFDFKDPKNSEKAARYRSVFARSLGVAAADRLSLLVRTVYEAKLRLRRNDKEDDGIRMDALEQVMAAAIELVLYFESYQQAGQAAAQLNSLTKQLAQHVDFKRRRLSQLKWIAAPSSTLLNSRGKCGDSRFDFGGVGDNGEFEDLASLSLHNIVETFKITPSNAGSLGNNSNYNYSSNTKYNCNFGSALKQVNSPFAHHSTGKNSSFNDVVSSPSVFNASRLGSSVSEAKSASPMQAKSLAFTSPDKRSSAVGVAGLPLSSSAVVFSSPSSPFRSKSSSVMSPSKTLSQASVIKIKAIFDTDNITETAPRLADYCNSALALMMKAVSSYEYLSHIYLILRLQGYAKDINHFLSQSINSRDYEESKRLEALLALVRGALAADNEISVDIDSGEFTTGAAWVGHLTTACDEVAYLVSLLQLAETDAGRRLQFSGAYGSSSLKSLAAGLVEARNALYGHLTPMSLGKLSPSEIRDLNAQQLWLNVYGNMCSPSGEPVSMFFLTRVSRREAVLNLVCNSWYPTASLRRTVYSAGDSDVMGVRALRRGGFVLSELKSAGFSVADLRATDSNSDENMRNLGYSLLELKTAGFTAGELKGDGVTICELKDLGFTLADIKEAGFSLPAIKAARHFVSELKSVGFAADELKSVGYTATELRTAGYSCDELAAGSFSANDLKLAKFTAEDLRNVGFSAADCRGAGFTLAELKLAGYTALDLKNSGYSLPELRLALYGVVELKRAGYAASELLAARYAHSELKKAGFTIDEFHAAGCSIANLRSAGFTAADVRNYSYSLSSDGRASVSATELKAAGYSMADLKAAGFSPAECGTGAV